MNVLSANIPETLAFFLLDLLAKHTTHQETNGELNKLTGIPNFFDNEIDWRQARHQLTTTDSEVNEHNTIEYGDFQTSESLANRVCNLLAIEGHNPTLVLEPTCGQGNFIVAVLKQFKTIQTIYGIEIYKPYLYQCKFNILSYYNDYPSLTKPTIHLLHRSIFDIDLGNLINVSVTDELLIIGNPPWVTNATLGAMASSNLPIKSNFKQHSGLDAVTGKSNFDIAEFIIIQLVKQFQHQRGHLALLVKSSVIKNIVHSQLGISYATGEFKKRVIDAKKEFNVSVDASLFTATLNKQPAITCTELPLGGDLTESITFGWVNKKFVSDKGRYELLARFDGICPFEWRQGLKHDCSGVMELDRNGSQYSSTVQSFVDVEDDLVFPLYKSSDLQKTVVTSPRKYTLVTQRRIGQDTGYIRIQYPLTYQYLRSYQIRFDNRKSSIYKGKPPYSIFGIGDYSFKPFKVAISSLYKEAQFALVMPINGKPSMLDDTCYFLGFDSLIEAIFTLLILNYSTTRDLLRVITFSDAKRVYTKDILMRVDLARLAASLSWWDISQSCPESLCQYISQETWKQFQPFDVASPQKVTRQLSLFQ